MRRAIGATLVAALPIVGLLAVAACVGLQEPDTGREVSFVVSPVSGGDQRAPAGARLAEPIRVRVTTPEGRPVAEVPIAFEIASGGGSVEPRIAETDANGVAQARWTLGPAPGDQVIEARIQLIRAAFRATALPSS